MEYIDCLTMSKNKEMIESNFEIFEKIYNREVSKSLGVVSNLKINQMIEMSMKEVNEKDRKVFNGFLDLFVGILYSEQDFFKAKKSSFALISVLD